MQASGHVRNSELDIASPGGLVRHIGSLAWQESGEVRWATAFGSTDGAEALTLFAVEVISGETQPVDAGSSESVLYVLGGCGQLSMGDRKFEIAEGDGAHVRAGEQFILQQTGSETLRALILVCPSPAVAPWKTEALETGSCTGTFDQHFPDRVVSARAAKRESTGDRSFRILVGPKIGSQSVTQFIGTIPLSRAPEHFHLYEEVICVLSGDGRAWIGDQCTAISKGSLIFLPREQPHCLECTSEEGLELIGMFYPAGSPAVNYSTDAA